MDASAKGVDDEFGDRDKNSADALVPEAQYLYDLSMI